LPFVEAESGMKHGRMASPMVGIFRNRTEAGRRLAALVGSHVKPPFVVGALSPAGVVVALPVAWRFGVPLAIVETRPLYTPLAPAAPFGAVDEDGHTVLEYTALAGLRLSAIEIAAARREAMAAIGAGPGIRGLPGLGQHLPTATVVLVTDALEARLEMEAAVAYARRHGARKIVVAAPCATPSAAHWFRSDVDRFLTLVDEGDYEGADRHYLDFSPVTADDVSEPLRRQREARAQAMRLEVG
jgi:putative phosphoribosyl transferase